MINVVGSNGSLALVANSSKGVIVDTNAGLIVRVGELADLRDSQEWLSASVELTSATLSLVSSALIDVPDTALTSGANRMFTIPGGVQAEAKKALKWRHEAKRGGTPVGLNTARTLAKGGQIGIEKVRHIAKYFPRHEVDKKGKGWEPGEEHFPSNGRIAWALWGGDAGQRWASAIVERENKKALMASGLNPEHFFVDDMELDNPFQNVNEFDEATPEFMIRVRLDGSGIDRLYKIEIDGSVYVWDNNCWDTLGHVDGDVYTYDSALDDPYDLVEKDYFIIDAGSAVIVASILNTSPFALVSLEDIDKEESRLFADSMPYLDTALLDLAITAAGGNTTTPTISDKSSSATDGNYTSAERSANAENQLRDATGRFAANGSRVVVGGDRSKGSGIVTKTDPTTGMVTVKLDNGKTIQVGAKYTQAESTVPGYKLMPEPSSVPLDTSGILGKPRMSETSTGAQLPGTLPPLTTKDIHNVINNWPKYVKDMRSGFKPQTVANLTKFAKDIGKSIRPGGPGIDELNK